MRRGVAVGFVLVLVILSVVAIMFFDLSGALATGTKLEYKYKKGDIDKYKVGMDMKLSMPDMPGGMMPSNMDMNMKMTVIQETLSTSFNGNAKVRMTMKDMQLDVPGMPMMGQGTAQQRMMQQMPPTVLTCTITKDGQIIDIEAEDKSAKGAGSFGAGSMGQFSKFPRKKIPVGGTWTEKLSMMGKTGDVDVTSSLVAADVPLWTEKACKIKQSFNGKMTMEELMAGLGGAFGGGAMKNNNEDVDGSVEVSGDSLIYFSPKLGKMLKTDGKFSAKITVDVPPDAVKNGMPSKLSMIIEGKIHVTRFK